LGIVLAVDLQGLLVYDIEQRGMSHGFPQKAPVWGYMWKNARSTSRLKKQRNVSSPTLKCDATNRTVTAIS
ncbi:MAG: hypothetical protein ACE5I2_16805, partial [Anaerolineae bacterium]